MLMPEPKRRANEKIFWVLNKLIELRELSPDPKKIFFDVRVCVNYKLNVRESEASKIVQKLLKNKIIKHISKTYNGFLGVHEIVIDDKRFNTLYSGLRGKIFDVNSSGDIQYIFEKEGRFGKLILGQYKIKFSGRIAVIVYFFYEKQKVINQYSSYDQYNNFLLDKYFSKDDQASSTDFRLTIDDINKRVKAESDGFVERIIVKKNKKTPKEKNMYKWLIKSGAI